MIGARLAATALVLALAVAGPAEAAPAAARFVVDVTCRTATSNTYTECMRRCRLRRDRTCRATCTRDYRAARRQCFGRAA